MREQLYLVLNIFRLLRAAWHNKTPVTLRLANDSKMHVCTIIRSPSASWKLLPSGSIPNPIEQYIVAPPEIE